MAKDLFNRYIWLVDTIYRAGKITFEEINERWKRNAMSRGEDLPVRTFHNHRAASKNCLTSTSSATSAEATVIT